MRITLVLAIAVGLALVAVVVVRHGSDDSRASAATGAVTLVGDSLNVGVEPYLGNALPGWKIDAHDRVGRPTSEGVTELRSLRRSLAPVVVVSLGTNDADGSESEFRKLVDEAIDVVGPGRCLVWATIVRDGEERTGFDRALKDARDAHANVHLVDWASTVADDPSLLAPDRVHGTPEGYRRRAQEIADVVRGCG
jgi:lysophospholipase L1-like esterase